MFNMGGLSSRPAAEAPKADPPSNKDDAPIYQFGWEGKKRGGVMSSQPLQRHLSSVPDEMELWRIDARSMRIMEMLHESNEAIDKYPEEKPIRMPEIDLQEAVGQACHRQCEMLWTAYDTCKEKTKSHEKCNGWWATYGNCLDTCSPKLTLRVLEALVQSDADPNMERLKR